MSVPDCNRKIYKGLVQNYEGYIKEGRIKNAKQIWVEDIGNRDCLSDSRKQCGYV